LSASQFAYLHADPAFPAQLGKRYHDLSATSPGVLADVKNGGLKRDLSHIHTRPTPAEFRAAPNSSGYNIAPLSSGNAAISTASTPYAELPSGISPNLLDYSTTWEQLWSHYNLGNPATATALPPGAVNDDGALKIQLPTPTRQGIAPLFVQGKLFYRLRYN